jgi:hypothetical protein
LYEPEDARTYADCDLLVSPEHFDAAVVAISKLGYEPEVAEGDLPAWWREHALSAVRSQDGAAVDIHRSLPGVLVSHEQAWETLFRATEATEVGGRPVRTLDAPGRLLHVALHTAQHAGSFRDRGTLARALDRAELADWEAAADLAFRLGATAAFRRGLEFLPDGAQMAVALGIPADADIAVELRAMNAPEALTLARLHGSDSLSAKLEIVQHKLFPPATFMRRWSPLARTGRAGLMVSYLWRPLWVLSRLPRAERAHRRARKVGDRPQS